MIFRNGETDPTITPGMGYASGSSELGYVSHIGYASGSSTLGDISASELNAGIDANISPSDLDLLNSIGATDQDIENLINGNQTLAQVYAKYGVTINPAAATPIATPAPASAPAGQVPGGSTLLYTANWTAGVGNLTVSPNGALAQLQSALGPHGMSVVSGQATSSGPINYGIQVLVLDTIGNALLTDAKSVLDALMQQIIGNNLSGTNLSIATTPGQATTPGALPASDPITFLENNMLYIGLGIGALIFLNNFTGKRR